MPFRNPPLSFDNGWISFSYLCTKTFYTMSSCIIKRNKERKIERVSTPSGARSTLFDRIAGIAALSDTEKAADALMTVYGAKFKAKFGDWESAVKRNGLRETLRFRIVGSNGMRLDANAMRYLDEAKRYEKIGFAAKDIWAWTGWYKGPDDRWRYEIPDTDMGLSSAFLDNVNNFKEDDDDIEMDIKAVVGSEYYDDMVVRYPSFGSVNVVIEDLSGNIGLDYYGYYDPESNEIHINGTVGKNRVRQTLIHEIQHFIQGREYFSKGSNEDSVKQEDVDRIKKEILPYTNISMYEKLIDIYKRSVDKKNGKALTEESLSNLLRAEMLKYKITRAESPVAQKYGGSSTADVAKLKEELAAIPTNEVYEDYEGDIDEAYDKAIQKANEFEKKIKKGSDDLEKLARYEAYRRVYGEIEARNTDYRSRESLYDIFPMDTEDVPKGERIVRFEPTVISFSNSLSTDISLISKSLIDNEASGEVKSLMASSKGWYDTETDTVTIVADNIESEEDLEKTILHEVVAHKGLRGLLGDTFDSTMEQVFSSMSESDREDYMAKYGDAVTAAEEYMASLAETNPESSLWDKIVSLVKDTLRSMGINLKMSDAELRNLLVRSKENLSPVDEELAKPVNEVNERLSYESGEPRLFFRGEGNRVYQDYGEAVRKSTTGRVTAGFLAGTTAEASDTAAGSADISFSGEDVTLNNPEAFIPVLSISTDSNISTRLGYVNYLVKKGMLSGERVRLGSKYYLTGAGNSDGLKIFNAIRAAGELRNRFGGASATLNTLGSIDFETEVDKDRVDMLDHDGKPILASRSMMKSMIREGRYSELDRRYEGMPEMAASLILEDGILEGNNDSLVADAKAEDLQNRTDVMNILSTLGIRVMGMSEYLENYEVRNGVEPSARALADMANGVIAVAENATVGDLNEETAHFLVDTYRNQSEIDDVLQEVRSSEEWKTYAPRYYEAYGKKYEGAELDRMVEREILGKMLAARFSREALAEASLDIENESSPMSLLARIIQAVRSFFTGEQRTRLNEVLNRIKESALANDPNAFDILLLKDSDHLMYSLGDREVAERLQREKRTLERAYRNMRRLKSGLQYDLEGNINSLRRIEEEMKGIGDELDTNSIISSTISVISTANAEVEYMATVAKALVKGRKKGVKIDYETAGIVDNVFNTMVPMIKNLRGFVNNQGEDYFGARKKMMVDKMDHIISLAESSMSDIRALTAGDESFIEERLKAMNIPEKARGIIKNTISSIQKDITMISRYFGTLEHSSNPILRMLGRELADMNTKGRTEGIRNIHEMTKMAKERNWSVSDSEGIIQRNPDGSMSDYIESALDEARYDLNLRTAQAEAIIEIYNLEEKTKRKKDELVKELLSDSGMEIEVGEETVGYEKDGVTPVRRKVKHVFKPRSQNFDASAMSIDDFNRFSRKMDEWHVENSERPMVQEYYDRIEKIRRKVAGKIGREMSPETDAFLTRIRRDRYARTQKFMKDGKVDFAAMSKDPIAWRSYLDISRDRAMAKSEFLPNGYLKPTGSPEALMAEEIRAWDEAWAEENEGKESKVSETFMDMLRTIEKEEGGKAAMEFLLAGGHLGFSKDMWQSDSDERNYYERLMDEIGKVNTVSPTLMKAIDNANIASVMLDKATKKLNALLMPFRDYSRFGEYDFDRMMGSGVMNEINLLYEQIAGYKSTIISTANKLDIDFGAQPEVESIMTDSYKNALKDSGLTELEFCLRNMPYKSRERINRFGRSISMAKPSLFSKQEMAFLVSMFGENPVPKLKEAVRNGGKNRILTEYAKRRTYPYMRRYAPAGYSEFISGVNKGRISVYEFFSDREKGITPEDSRAKYSFDINLLDITPNRQWMEESDEISSMKNPNYDTSLGYGRHIPKREIYRDQRYLDKYGIREETVDDGNGNMVTREVATRNIETWNMRNEFLAVSRRALEGYDEKMRSIYLIPQISKGAVERLAQAGVDPKAAAGNMVRDIISSRVDDPLHGQTADLGQSEIGDNIYRTIPKYYLTMLEERSDVSHDFTFAYAMLGLQAAMYSSKREALGTVMGYRNKMLEMEYDGGKTAEGARSYEMFMDWVNASIYDVRVNNKRAEWNVGNYKIDLNKLALAWTKFVSVVNLGLSPFVALTGALTGQGNFLLEGIVGQYIGKDSMKYAYGEAMRHLSSYAEEIGDVNRDNKLYVTGEAMGIFNVRNRVSSAGYNKIWRTLFRDIPFKMMEVMNSPLDPQVMISVLDDMRYYNGEFVSFTDFKEMCIKERRMSPEEASKEWGEMRDRSFWNMTEVKDGKITATDPAMQETINRYIPTASARVRSMVQICDGALNEQNRVGASRNVFMNMVLPHRGWAILAAQRAFKKEGYNFQTMRFEKGYDRSLIHLVNQVYKTMSEGRMVEIYEVLKEEYHSLPEHEQNNIRRAIVNLAMMAIFAGVGRALMGYRDDNEDSWFAQFVCYLGFRFINEMASQVSPFMEANAVDMLEDPLVTARKFGDLVDIRNWDPFSEVKTGVYKGESKLWRQLMKFSFGKQWYNIKTARDIKQTSDYWLMTNSMTSLFFFGGNKRKDEEEDPNWFFDRGR